MYRAGVKPWVEVTSNGTRPANCEVTYWRKQGRTLVFVLYKAATEGNAAATHGADRLVETTIPIVVEFPRPVQDVVDERSGKKLGAGTSFRFELKPTEAVFFSFAGRPPR